MNGSPPHFVLFSDTLRPGREVEGSGLEGWKFILKSADSEHAFSASDTEPDTRGERLELLAVVRGLESLDQPSKVTLVTKSRYVSRGLRDGLESWRTNDWHWERFGEMVPVSNRDLWQRVDRALRFHQVRCRKWRIDGSHIGQRDIGQRDIGQRDIGQRDIGQRDIGQRDIGQRDIGQRAADGGSGPDFDTRGGPVVRSMRCGSRDGGGMSSDMTQNWRGRLANNLRAGREVMRHLGVAFGVARHPR